MKIAIYGGSFNPIHNAHIKLAKRFIDEIKLDKVYFVPTFLTPLKNNDNSVAAYHRLKMCEIALDGFDNLFVSDIEVNRQGISYSCDTIASFKQMFKGCELYFILGADMFLTLEKWHNFEYIFDNVTLLTAPRDDCVYNELCEKATYYNKKYSCNAYITKEYIADLSSTMIREMYKNGEDVSCFVDKNVLEYIVQNDLYR